MECVKSSSSSGVSEVEGKSPSETLTPFMLAKIERNRQRALMLRQARLANRPSAGEGVCVCVLKISIILDTLKTMILENLG